MKFLLFLPHRVFMKKILSQFWTYYQDYTPKSLICWREGYFFSTFLKDAFAGVMVALIALPLAIAVAIGSGLSPEQGIFTAIVAGFLISLLGGSRVQIGGPTGTFVVIVYEIVQNHGYQGLVIATLLAGILMILMGLSRCGVLLKFVPYPVTTGFTLGIAVIIFSSQIKNFFGLEIASLPPHFLDRWETYFSHAHTWNPLVALMAFGTLLFIFTCRYFSPKIPGAFIAIILTALLTESLDLPLETLETKFGGLSRLPPVPTIPYVTWQNIQELFPFAVTLAFLGAIESLLSAVVADGITGHRHRSNCELTAQGIANLGSVLCGGIPAAGGIARTIANIKLGAKTPVAGLIHALTLLFILLVFAPFISKIPLCTLAAVLMYIAWNMCSFDQCLGILKNQFSDALVLIMTSSLVILIDLTVAVQVGIILSAILFLKKMTDSTTIEACRIVIEEEAQNHLESHDAELLLRQDVPPEVTIFEIKGPFFFGVANSLNETLRRLTHLPDIFILRMRQVPIVDTTGLQALNQFAIRCQELGIIFMISGPNESVLKLFRKAGLEKLVGKQHIFPHIDAALQAARLELKQKSLETLASSTSSA